MEEAKYKIIAKVISGIEITDFIITDGTETKAFKLDVVTKLARSGKIENARARLNTVTEQYTLILDDKLEDIPLVESKKTLKLIGRIIKDDKCIGYKAVDDIGKSYKLSIEKVWSLSNKGLTDGYIEGVQAKIINNKKVLLSTDECKIYNLPKIKM